MRLRRPRAAAPAPEIAAEPAPDDPTAVQPAAAAGPADPPATTGPGPVPDAAPDSSPRPPITGAHPVVHTAGQPGELEGQRAWLAVLDRRLGTRTYAGAAAMVLSLAASIVAIVLAIDARDNSAGLDDLNRVETQLAESVNQGSAAGETALNEVNALSSRLSTLEDRVDELATIGDGAVQRIEVVEDDIADLRQQISDLGGAPGGATGSGTDAP